MSLSFNFLPLLYPVSLNLSIPHDSTCISFGVVIEQGCIEIAATVCALQTSDELSLSCCFDPKLTLNPALFSTRWVLYTYFPWLQKSKYQYFRATL